MKKGFTLIEILLTVSIISIIGIGTIKAVQPAIHKAEVIDQHEDNYRDSTQKELNSLQFEGF